jgi:hypothetical protein
MTDGDNRYDPGIPTLTIQSEPEGPLPVLTEVVRGAAPPPPEPVLRAALQAELEHTIQQALESAVAQAMVHVRGQLEAELPALVERVVQRLRPG